MTDQAVEQAVAGMQQEQAVEQWKEQQPQPEPEHNTPTEALEKAKGLLGVVEPQDEPALATAPIRSPEAPMIEQAVGRIQQVNAQLQAEAQQLESYLNSQEFAMLKQQDPGTAAMQLQEAEQIRWNLQQNFEQVRAESGQVYQVALQERMQAIYQSVPGWHDPNTADREGTAMLEHFGRQGYSAADLQAVMLKNPAAARAIWDRWQAESAPRRNKLRGGRPMKMGAVDGAFDRAKKGRRKGRRTNSDAVKIAGDALRSLGIR